MKVEKLTGIEDWGMWKFEVRVNISASGAMDVVSGDFVKPVAEQQATAAYEKKLEKWNKLDSLAQKTIVQMVSRRCKFHIINCQSAK